MTLIGSVLAGKYRVERMLGQGGMGVVVQATHLQLAQPVAMKFLLPSVMSDPQIVQRFLREAQAAVRLKSEHVARVIDVGTLEAGEPYMVLEYLDGTDLAHYPRAQLSTGTIIDLVLQACEALAEAHAIDIVHRDIKPANFFVTRRADGSLLLKILDFGISKAPTGDSQLTGTQTVMGTPAYMSPEQMKSSRSVDGRSDLWSLGIVLYELLQGQTPFQADTFSSMIIKVATEALPPMTVRLPGRLAEIVYRCLDKEPARRFQNVAELARALAPYAQSATQATISVERTSRVMGATLPPQAGEPRYLPSTITGSAGAVTSPPGTARRWPIALGALGLVAIIGVIGAMVAGGSGEPARDPAPAAAHPSAALPPPPPATAPSSAPAPAPAAPTPSAATAATAAPTPATPAPAEPAAAAPAPAAPAPSAPIAREPAAAPAQATPRQHPSRPPAVARTPAPDPKAKPAKPGTPPEPGPGSASGGDDILGTRN